MTRSAKKKGRLNYDHISGPQDNVRVMIDISDSEDESVASPRHPQVPQNQISQQQQKSKQKKKSKQVKVSKAARAETPEDSEDELGNAAQLASNSGRKLPLPISSRREKQIVKALEKAAAILSSLGSPADLKDITKDAERRTDDTSNQIRNHCATILELLSASRSALTPQNNSEIPDNIHDYDQYFAHQGPGRKIYILRPVEVLKGNTNLTRGKVVGFIQHKGANFPLRYALPGWTPCVEEHPLVLESELWTKEVQRWGVFHNHHFQSHPFDNYHGKEKGHACASHVEPSLMLWFACDRLRELRGIDKPVRILLGELFRLRDYDEKMEAEIFLTRAPCRKCLEIKKLIEDYTRIVFHIRVFPNLGELQAQKSKHGWMTFPTYAQVIDDDDNGPDLEDAEFENDEDEENDFVEKQIAVEKSKSKFAVVLRGNPNTPQKQKQSMQQQLTPPSTESSAVRKTSIKNQKRHIQSFTFQSTNALTVNNRHLEDYDSESDISDYQPSSNPRKAKSSILKVPNQGTYRPRNETSSGSPFGAEARRQAKLLERERERKRHAKEDSSPSLAKKARHTRF